MLTFGEFQFGENGKGHEAASTRIDTDFIPLI